MLLPFPFGHNSLADDATDPENMLTMLHTWQTGDVSKQEPYNGDFSAAMKGIKAKTLVLPSKTDLYFRESCDLFFFCCHRCAVWEGVERTRRTRRKPSYVVHLL
jgi:hypothetical protein